MLKKDKVLLDAEEGRLYVLHPHITRGYPVAKGADKKKYVVFEDSLEAELFLEEVFDVNYGTEDFLIDRWDEKSCIALKVIEKLIGRIPS